MDDGHILAVDDAVPVAVLVWSNGRTYELRIIAFTLHH